MTISIAAVTPHPPILIDEIGGPATAEVDSTRLAMRTLADSFLDAEVETMVLISPHHYGYGSRFAVTAAATMRGSFAPFGYPDLSYELPGDRQAAELILAEAEREGLPVSGSSALEDSQMLDHGFLVPYSLLSSGRRYPSVELSLAEQPLELHYRFGLAVGRALHSRPERVAFVASGDLSHRLTRQAPAGYSPSGADFDKLVVEKVSLGRFRELMDIPQKLVEEAGECGLRSMIALAGVLEGREFGSHVLSYEGPFGVGYLTAIVRLAQ